MSEPTARDYDAAHRACRCPTAKNNPRVRLSHPGCKLHVIAQSVADERARLLVVLVEAQGENGGGGSECLVWSVLDDLITEIRGQQERLD